MAALTGVEEAGHGMVWWWVGREFREAAGACVWVVVGVSGFRCRCFLFSFLFLVRMSFVFVGFVVGISRKLVTFEVRQNWLNYPSHTCVVAVSFSVCVFKYFSTWLLLF